MRPATLGLAAFLASNRYYGLFDLISFKTIHGELLQYSGTTSAFTFSSGFFPSQSINVNGGTFTVGPRFGRTHITSKIGTQVDTMDLQIIAGSADMLGVLTWQQAFADGVFDGAIVEVDRLVTQNNAAVGVIVWFQGLVGEVDIGRSLITVKANSMTALLRNQMPRRLWQPSCTHVFGDAMCQFDRTSLNSTLQCIAGSSQGEIVTAISPNPSNLYDGGTITNIYGANAGYTRGISQVQGSIVFLTVPFIYPVNTGDTFELLPGCDHQVTTCQNTFNNLSHYGGFPYIPPPEFSV
jgi:uncharacterized phage protein (TIGR02218 family)